jgi:hypothetical protein
MHLIFKPEHKELLEGRYTILELETIQVAESDPVTAWCVIEAEKIIPEIDMLPLNKSLHEDLLTAIKEDQPEQAKKLCAELKGKFGGELDTFYEEIVKRIEHTGSCAFVPVPQ